MLTNELQRLIGAALAEGRVRGVQLSQLLLEHRVADVAMRRSTNSWGGWS